MKQKNGSQRLDPYWFLEATIHQEGKSIFNLAYRLCGNREEAGEIARETFLRVLEKCHLFESRLQVYTYLYRTTFALWKNRTRHKARQPALDGQLPLLQKALAGLTASENFTIILRDIEGKSHLEIAHIMECPYGTVKSRLARAREQLRTNLCQK